MSLESSAINEMVHLAANAQALWSTDALEVAAAPRQLAGEPPRRSEGRVATVCTRASDRRASRPQLACIIGLTMITVAIGLALQGDGYPVVGTAAAAAPAPAAMQTSTITVTPIEGMTVTPIEVPSAAATTTNDDLEIQIHDLRTDAQPPAMAVAKANARGKKSGARKAKPIRTKRPKQRS